MKKNILTVVGITILFLGLAISPVIRAIDKDTMDADKGRIKIYKFAKIKTTKSTGGLALCIPGIFRSIFLSRCTLLHSFIAYRYDNCEEWYLTINSEMVPRGNGYIIGFSGQINNWIAYQFGMNYYTFDINGSSLLIIHISD